MATANNLGTAYIRIAPQMEGIQSTIQNAMNKAGSEGADSFNKGFSLKAGAIAGVISSVTTKAINAITNQFSAAVTRVDTLNVFPKIMKNLGYETDESTRSIERLTQRIEGLPTTLDEIVTWTQRLASSMNSLADGEMNATDLAIAFNDAALAGGKGQAEANRAFEQYVQIIGRGRPMMQDWKIMLEVMPGQLKQMAKYLGENSKSLQEYAARAKKTVDQLDGMDLYEWISEDKNAYAKERLAEFNEALVKLDKEGGAGVTAFKDQVGDATHTIGTAMRLIGVRISKALATVIQAFGAGDIYEVIDKFTKSFAKVADWIVTYVVPPIKEFLIPAIANVLKAFKAFIEYLSSPEGQWAKAFVIGLVGTFITLKTVIPVITAVKAAMIAFGTSIAGVAGVATTSMLAITGLVASIQAISAAVEFWNTAEKYAADMRKYSEMQIVNETNALRNLNQARENEQKILEDLETAKRLQNDAEYQELTAKQRLAEAQKAYDDILKNSNATDDQKRMKALELKAAEDAYTDAIQKHKDAVAETKKLDEERYAGLMTGLNTQNRLIAAQMLQDQQYGTLAKRLDELKTKTISYKNAQGEVITMSKKEMSDLADWYAESLKRNDTTWRNIVATAESQGISFVEACERAGFAGGETFDMRFAAGIDQYTPFALNASETTVDKVAKQVQDSLDTKRATWQAAMGKMLGIGKMLVGGLDEGMQSKMADLNRTLNKFGTSIPDSVKKLLGIHSPSRVFMNIGQQIDQGLIDGLGSYSDRIEEEAKSIAESVVSPFNQEAQLSLGATGSNVYGQSRMLQSPQQSLGATSVVQNNTFNQVADDLDVEEASKLLGWQVATAL